MRHHLTSITFAVKFLCIGFVCFMSISLYAAQETGQESVAELMAQLFSDEEETWRPAVKAVARLEDKVVLTLAEEVKRDLGRFFRVSFVFENFTSAAAKKQLIALLDDKDERICQLAAEALMKHGNSSAAPALTKAMERVQDDQIRWYIACALWKVGANDQSAEAILTVARNFKGRSKDALFSIVDNPIGRSQTYDRRRKVKLSA